MEYHEIPADQIIIIFMLNNINMLKLCFTLK